MHCGESYAAAVAIRATEFRLPVATRVDREETIALFKEINPRKPTNPPLINPDEDAGGPTLEALVNVWKATPALAFLCSFCQKE